MYICASINLNNNQPDTVVGYGFVTFLVTLFLNIPSQRMYMHYKLINKTVCSRKRLALLY